MNFGERMAQIRRDNERRLYGAVKRNSITTIFASVEVHDQVIGAVRCIQAQGQKAELIYDAQTNELKLGAVEYTDA